MVSDPEDDVPVGLTEPDEETRASRTDASRADKPSGASRREVLLGGALIGGTLALAGTAVGVSRARKPPATPSGEASVRELPGPPQTPSDLPEDPLLTMQRDLARAMAKPREERHWIMVIDTTKCVGCSACTIGCVAENKLPPGVVYRPVVTEERGEYPNVTLSFLPRPCMQCDDPPCVPVCPVRATWKGPDGVVVIDYDRCIGCRYCLTACPYGARTSDFGLFYVDGAAEGAPDGDGRPVAGLPAAWEVKPSNEYLKSWDREHHQSPVGNARKCHFCLHRLNEGLLPMCVTTCIGRATYFGDGNDDRALATRLAAAPNARTLLPEKGTQPQVFYIS